MIKRRFHHVHCNEEDMILVWRLDCLLALRSVFVIVSPAVFPTRVSSRVHEQEVTKKHERDLIEMHAIHNRETQNMLSDFNKAQELLKDKITALQIL